MYFTDDSLFPENMQPTIITAAPYGPEWLPGDVEELPVSFDQQVQAARDCWNAGATMLHFHVRDPKTGQGSSNFEQYNELLARVKQAVPKMIIQVGGSISFAPHTEGAKAKWLDYDTRHMLTELDPKPEFVTVTTGTTLWDVTMAMTPEDIKGTHLDDPKVLAAWSGMVVDSTPAFYIEHLKRLRQNKIQPYFVPGHVHQLEIIERLVRSGVHMGPVNLALCGYGGGSMGRNPFDWMEMLRRTPHGASSVTFWSSMRGNIAIQSLATLLGQHVRVGNEDNIWDMHKKRWSTPKQIEWAVRQSEQFGRKVASADEARRIMKVGVWYETVEETLFNLGLPPNRPDGQQGFLTYATDGKLPQAGGAATSPVSIL
ncbi:MAG TPA: 3-keto-5-aminohexanoate cleavage protein [Rubrivivax sp.]|nr:3-keto-5-aminohexanoate cleavage protein [Rubrivivax sp.]